MPRKKWRPSSGGYSFRKSVRDHALWRNKQDLREQAAKLAKAMGTPPDREIVPGVTRANYVAGLGIVDDAVADIALAENGTAEARTYDYVRKNRPVKADGTLPVISKIPERATEYFAASYPPHVTIMMVEGARRGYANPMPAVEANLEFVTTLFANETGLRPVMTAFHTPNPYTDEELEKRGWVCGVHAGEESKLGGWNYHPQLYFSRIKDRRLIGKHRDLRYCDKVLLSQLWLMEIGVDIHAASRASFEREIRSAMRDRPSKMPKDLVDAVTAKAMTGAEAVEECVRRGMLEWDQQWAMARAKNEALRNAGKPAKHDESMQDRVLKEYKDRCSVQHPADHLVSFAGTRDLVARMAAIDPRYQALFEESKEIYCEMKRRQMVVGDAKLLNEIYGDILRERRDAAQRLRDQESEASRADRALYEEAFGTGAGVLAWSQAQAREEAEGELADLADAERRERDAVAKALDAERAAKEAAECEKADAVKARAEAEKKALASEMKAQTLEAEKRDERAFAADVQKTLSSAVAVSAPDTLVKMKRMMATGVVPEGAEAFFEVNKTTGRIWPAPLYRAMQQVLLREDVGTPEQRAAAKDAQALASAYMAFLKTKPTSESLAAKRLEWANAYPAPVPPAPVVVERIVEVVQTVPAEEIEKLVKARLEAMTKPEPAQVDVGALMALGKRRGAAKALLVPRVDAAIQWIDDQQAGRGGSKPAGIDALIESAPVTGGWVFTPKLVDELIEIEEVLPEVGKKLRKRANGCEMVAFTIDFVPIVEAVKVKLMPKDERPVTSVEAEAWFHLETDILHGYIVLAAEAAVRDAKGPFRDDPVVQDRAVAAKELLRLNEMPDDRFNKEAPKGIGRDPGEEWKADMDK